MRSVVLILMAVLMLPTSAAYATPITFEANLTGPNDGNNSPGTNQQVTRSSRVAGSN